jgi:hypothetical protein
MREENKLIAEFMGYKTYEHTNSIAIRLLEENEFNSIDIGHIHTKFHASWDWLMPVVEKIRKIHCYDRGDIFNVQFIISNDRIEFYQGGYTKEESYWYQNNGIESVYKAVIGCITMYNNELKP